MDWERTRVFAPLGMERTRFEVDSTVEADLATGYIVEEDGTIDDRTAAREVREGRGFKVPNGALFTTVDDLARFVAFELDYGPDSVLAKSVLDEAFGGIVVTDRSLQLGYGLGFMVMHRDDYEFPLLGHLGSVPGYRAAMLFDRGIRLGVVVFSNVTGGEQEPFRLGMDILTLLGRSKVATIQADIDRRFQAQVASPGSDAALRRLITELRAGRPDYDRMSPAMAREARREVAAYQASLSKLGALESLTFTGVGAAGPNIYRATFERGALEWRIWMNLDGSVDAFRFVAVQPSR